MYSTFLLYKATFDVFDERLTKPINSALTFPGSSPRFAYYDDVVIVDEDALLQVGSRVLICVADVKGGLPNTSAAEVRPFVHLND
jgi:hypothetical protein